MTIRLGAGPQLRGNMRKTNDAGIALIKRYEGFSAQPYICPAGYETIGYGHVVRAGENFSEGIDMPWAEQLLRDDLRTAERAVIRYIDVPLSDNQFAALASFTFNLGAGALQRSTLRRVVNRGEHFAVPHQLSRWIYAGGKPLKGLVKRRVEEAVLYGSE